MADEEVFRLTRNTDTNIEITKTALYVGAGIAVCGIILIGFIVFITVM